MSFPVEERFIEKAEAELGIRFPESFRQKMMAKNGGEVSVESDSFSLLPFFDTSNKKRLKRTCHSIVHETRYAHEHYNLASNIIIIGNNGGGDSLVFRLNEEGSLENVIYWLDHENDELSAAAEDFADLEIIG